MEKVHGDAGRNSKGAALIDFMISAWFPGAFSTSPDTLGDERKATRQHHMKPILRNPNTDPGFTDPKRLRALPRRHKVFDDYRRPTCRQQPRRRVMVARGLTADNHKALAL
jgi:hypothetical protein